MPSRHHAMPATLGAAGFWIGENDHGFSAAKTAEAPQIHIAAAEARSRNGFTARDESSASFGLVAIPLAAFPLAGRLRGIALARAGLRCVAVTQTLARLFTIARP